MATSPDAPQASQRWHLSEILVAPERFISHLFDRWNLRSGRMQLLIWAIGRLAVLLTWGLINPETQGDVVYYYEHISFMFTAGPADTMTEYPTPVLWLLTVPWLLGFGTQTGYVVAFVLLMVALDVAFTLSLWAWGGRLRAHAVTFWTLFVVFIGPTVYLRFDLVTSVLAGWSLLLLLRRRWTTSGALAGVGAAIKLWPALLWPALLGGSRRQRIRTSLGFWICGGLLALASLLWAGWNRLVSPLSWQSGRGLQVESVWATVPMVLRAVGLGDYAVTISRFQAFEIYGTGIGFWSALASIATAAGMAILVAVFVLWWRHGHGTTSQAALLMMLVILTMIVTNKTFSPQYMIWLGGPMAAAIALLGRQHPDARDYALDRRRLWLICIAILTTTILTGIVFPIGYDPLVRDSFITRYWRLPVTIVLAMRNLLITALLGYVLRLVKSFVWPIARERRP
ncbi:glycosyltransferase 87 family protein [Brooklawnia sp.]|uniref:glycosyltransferase 87 family protein n=1 Tax=Brooklawnia sp. TaxID=2699740 RepID=UPI00311F7FE0